MEYEIFSLTDTEYKKLNAEYPHGKGSGLIGNRSEEIVKIYFRRKYPDCKFLKPQNGADLEVVYSSSRPSLLLEVKGTDDSHIAWQKLKVSSVHSRRMLVEENIPLYRVTKVFQRNPEIYILKYGEDFELEPEPRWSIKRTSDRSTKIGVDIEINNPGTNKDSMKRTSKYSSLSDFLKSQSGDEVTFLFSEAEKVLGFPLPESAKQYQAYWANQSDTTNRPWARAWQEAGFYVESYRLSGENGWVIFRRGPKR